MVTAREYDRVRDAVLAELYSSGGITYDRAAKEVLYYLPGDFVRLYTQIFHEAFRDTDGGTSGRGISNAEKGAVGRLGNPASVGGMGTGGIKHEPKDRNGKPIGSGHVRNTQKSMKGLKQASAKQMFGYNGALGEEAAALKDRIDKRLRSIARQAIIELQELKIKNLDRERERLKEQVENGEVTKGQASRRITEIIKEQQILDSEFKRTSGGGSGKGSGGKNGKNGGGDLEGQLRCKGCAGFMNRAWKFCASCGKETER